MADGFGSGGVALSVAFERIDHLEKKIESLNKTLDGLFSVMDKITLAMQKYDEMAENTLKFMKLINDDISEVETQQILLGLRLSKIDGAGK